MVFVVFGVAVLLALGLLYWFHARAWYWHLLSVAAALGVGFMPPLVANRTVYYDMAIGFVFLLLLVWGAAAPLFRSARAKHRMTLA